MTSSPSDPIDDLPAWQDKIRQAAYTQAMAESQAAWQVSDDGTVPFNYRWEHVQAVVGLALWLADEIGADLEVVTAAAWLHDVRKTEPNHSLAGAYAAAEILSRTDFPPEKILRVVQAISLHAGIYRPLQAEPLAPIEAAILWDADKLSKLGVQALFYATSTNDFAGKTLPERRQEQITFCRSVLARTVASMNTLPARRLAERRYQAMVETLAVWAEEEEQQSANGWVSGPSH